MVDAHVLLSLARILTAALAGTLALRAARTYLRLGQRSILALGMGAGLLAAGYLAEGLLVEIAGWSISDATVLESLTTLAGSALLVASLYLKEARATRTRRIPAAGETP